MNAAMLLSGLAARVGIGGPHWGSATRDVLQSYARRYQIDVSGVSDAPSPTQLKLQDAIVGTFFADDVPKASGGYTYAYGGRTRNKVLPSSSAGNAAVFATYFGDDYSGVNISLGNGTFLDLTPYRKTGSLTFWIKGGPNA